MYKASRLTSLSFDSSKSLLPASIPGPSWRSSPPPHHHIESSSEKLRKVFAWFRPGYRKVGYYQQSVGEPNQCDEELTNKNVKRKFLLLSFQHDHIFVLPRLHVPFLKKTWALKGLWAISTVNSSSPLIVLWWSSNHLSRTQVASQPF